MQPLPDVVDIGEQQIRVDDHDGGWREMAVALAPQEPGVSAQGSPGGAGAGRGGAGGKVFIISIFP